MSESGPLYRWEGFLPSFLMQVCEDVGLDDPATSSWHYSQMLAYSCWQLWGWELGPQGKRQRHSQPRHCSFSPCPVQTLTSVCFTFLLDNVALISQSKWSFISVQWIGQWWLIVIYQWCFNSLLAKSRHSFYIPSSMALSSISNFKPCCSLVFLSQTRMSFSFCCLNGPLIFFFFGGKAIFPWYFCGVFLPYSLKT